MTTSLRSVINELATQFAQNLLEALRGASLEDILAESGASSRRGGRGAVVGDARGRRGRGERLGRRSAADIEDMIQRIVELLQQNPEGLRAEQIREMLGVEAKELPRPLAEALGAGLVSKSGQKRATTYFAKGTGPRRGAKRSAVAVPKARGRRPAAKKPGRKSKISMDAPMSGGGSEQ